MDNAIPFDFLQYAQNDMKYLRDFPFPGLICDRSLRVYWKNIAALTNRKSQMIMEDLPRILEGLDSGQIFCRLEESGSYVIEEAFPFALISLHFTAIYVGKRVVGAALLIIGEVESYGKNHGNAGTSAALARGLRQDVSRIFDALDDAFLKTLKTENSSWLNPHFNRINASAYGILRTAVNISTYARLQNAEIEPRFVAFDIYSWLVEIHDITADIFATADIPVTLALSEEVTYLRLDSELFEIAFFNILHNSMTYSRPGNSILISAQRKGRFVELTVTDKGCGMAEEFLAKAHRPYFFGQQQDKDPGLGLGLALAKGLTELQNGTITIASRENEGTVVTLLFPNDTFAQDLPLAQWEPWEEAVQDNRFSYLYTGLMGGLKDRYPEKNPHEALNQESEE